MHMANRNTKKGRNECSIRGCDSQRLVEKEHCESHNEAHFYIDIAKNVNVSGEGINISKMLDKIKKERANIIKRRIANIINKSNPPDSIQYVNKREYNILVRRLTRRYNILCSLKTENKESYERIMSMDLLHRIDVDDIQREIREMTDSFKLSPRHRNTSCRWTDGSGSCCNRLAHRFIHTGWCDVHIGSPVAILCLIKRQIIMESDIMIEPLREILVSYI